MGLLEDKLNTIQYAFDKVLKDGKRNFDFALNWCINVKNPLTNVHGFTPYHLKIGTDPRLQSVLHDKPHTLTVPKP